MAHSPLESRIAALRGQVRRLLALHGLSWVLGSLVLAAIVAGLADWLVHLSSEVRLAELLVLAGLGIWLALRYVVAPLVVRFRDLDIALRIEQRWPGLNDRLASTVQFLKPDPLHGHEGSPALREATVRETVETVKSLDFREAIDPRPARRALGFAVGAIALCAVFFGFAPGLSRIAIARLIAPYGSARWPQLTHLKIVEAARKVARGDAFNLAVAVAPGERMPASARVTYRFPDGETATEPMREVEGGMFRGRIEAVSRSFMFWVAAGDDVTEWNSVEVVPPPAIESLTIHVAPPAYTALAPQTLAPGRTQIRSVEGTRVEIEAKANKPLADAAMHRGDSGAVEPVTLGKGRLRFSTAFTVASSDPFWFSLRDSEGFRNQEAVRYEVRSIKDEAPRVVFEEPDSDRDVPPTATVPVRITADDDFGVQSVRLIYRVASGSPEPTQLQARPLWKSDVVPAPGKAPEKHKELTDAWDLSSLSLSPGAIITFYAEARDFDNLKGPNLGKSRELRLRIATPEEIARQLDDRRREIYEETARILAMQKQGQRPVEEALRTLTRTQKLEQVERDALKNSEMIQRQVSSRVTSPSDGLDEQVQQFLRDLENFKLNVPDVRAQMERMKQSVNRIRQNHLAPAEQGLTRSLKALDDQPPSNSQPAAQQPSQKGAQPQPNQATRPAAPDAAAQAQPKNDAAKSSTAAGKESAPAKDQQASTDAGKQSAASKGSTQPPSSATGKESAAQKGDPQPPSSPAGKETAESKGDTQPQNGGQEQQPSGADQKPPQSGQTPSRQSPQVALTETKRSQQAIADELQKMLDGMSEFETFREAVKDAQKLLKEQEDAMKQSAEAASKPELMGKPAEALNEAQKAQLENLASRQAELAKGLQNLEGKMEEMAQRNDASDPLSSAALREAAQQSRQKGTSAKMNQSGEQLAKNQMGSARAGQEQARNDLKELVDALQNTHDRSLARLVKELKKAEAELEKLRQRQAKNLVKTEKARQAKDPQKRKEDLQRLAKEQGEIQKELSRQLQRLSKLRADAAAQAGSKASGKMSQAQQDLDQDQGEQAEKDQEETLADLQDAQDELEQARQDAEEQLAMEQLAKMGDTLKSLSQRQDKIVEETAGFEKARGARKGQLSLAQRNEVRNLGKVQEGMKDETGELIEKLEGAPVFALTLKRAAEAMENASQRLAKLQTDDDTQRSERGAAKRFQQLIEALKPDPAKPGGEQPGGGGGGGGGGSDDRIPTVAQLKMLKQLQQEINERTEYFDELRSRKKELTPAQEDELKALEEAERSIADLARDLTRPRRDDGEN